VNRETGRPRLVRAVAAVDSGQVVNPDGLVNQIEGAIVQSMSWTLYESVTFDDTRITSIDWQTYPILRFDAVPDRIDVHIIDRPGNPSSAAAKPGRGRPRHRLPMPLPMPPASGYDICLTSGSGSRTRSTRERCARLSVAAGRADFLSSSSRE